MRRRSMAFFNVGKWTPWIKFPDILRISEFQKEIHTVKAITNNGLKKEKKIHFRQDRQRNNQKYGELVALCVCGGGE